MAITETTTTLAQLDRGDVFRLASITYEAAIERQAFFIKQETRDVVITISLVDGTVVFDTPIDTEVIVHVATVVVLPND